MLGGQGMLDNSERFWLSVVYLSAVTLIIIGACKQLAKLAGLAHGFLS